MAMMLITHNLGVVAEMCDDVAVMYAGQIVEHGSVADVLQRPRMRYTQALLESVPRTDSPSHVRLPVIDGQPPNLIAPPDGCRFAQRCAHRSAQCDRESPGWTSAGPGHGYACWHPVART
jgi:oligopeptide/dipeptide ABC transporter ATP-binding protein